MANETLITPTKGLVIRWLSKDGYNDGYRVIATGKVRMMRWEGCGEVEPHVWTTGENAVTAGWISQSDAMNQDM